MSLIVLIPLSLAMGLIGLAAFIWALRNGQFEDPEGSAWRVIPPETGNRGPADTPRDGPAGAP